MGYSGVNKNFAKCFILFMATFILLQGCFYLALSISAVTFGQLSDKSYNLDAEPLLVGFNLIYFLRENDSRNLTMNNNTLNLNVTLTEPSKTAERTYILSLTYAVVSSLWIITSIFVMGSLCTTITKIVIAISFIPWLICILVGCVIDVISTIFYSRDILETTDFKKAFNYIGLNYNLDNDSENSLKNFDLYFMMPAVIMACISSRLILIWFLNILGSFHCLSLARALSQRNTPNVKNSTPDNSNTISITTSTQTMTENSTQYDEQQAEQDRLEPVKPNRIDNEQQLDIKQPKLMYLQHIDNISRQPSIKSSTQPSIKSLTQSFVNSIDETNISHPQLQLNMLKQQIPYETPLKTHYMNNYEEYYQNGNNIHNHNYHNQSNMHISEELKSHLPWSYINLQPRISFSHQHTYPAIPAPDYNRNE